MLFVLLNDLVLDVTEWADRHPGGRFLIEKTAGTDISKYFYGGYSYESIDKGGLAHAHSNYAKLIVNSLVIGRLDTCKAPTSTLMKV